MNLNKTLRNEILVLLIFVFFQISGIAQSTLLPDSMHTCKVDSLQLSLNTELSFDSYLWSTGDTLPTTWIQYTGDYSVIVTQGDTLTIYDTTFVNIVDARIVQSDTSILCTDTIMLSTSSSAFDYYWADELNYNTIQDTLSTEDSIIVSPRTTQYYWVDIYDPVFGFNYCRDSVQVTVNPLLRQILLFS
ncbi:MAG: hypothetical protein R2764_00485 [Bacteroidales bacterium]